MDDFGTGHSALNYLMTPVTTLIVNQALIQALDRKLGV
ncbi:hypothetical protein ACFO0D_06160 [Deinococcus hohokamensis]|uniref:EAL domain-containing protein n=1 Tax=Deinococcus hohokamensis TaxID=309883 RepID=A0ABV9I6Q8_9DEIO